MTKTKFFLGIAFCGIAVIALIFSIVCFSGLNTASYSSFKYYGGDAYTGIQQAAAVTGNNVFALLGNLSTISGLAFILSALILGTIGIYFVLEAKTNKIVIRPFEFEEPSRPSKKVG